jgi:catechol-2,3-dioxygenase
MAWQLGSFEELRAAHREIKEMGIPIEATIQHNITKSVYVKDPDGNTVELYCDRWEDGFKAMQTMGPRSDPLDMETGEVAARS